MSTQNVYQAPSANLDRPARSGPVRMSPGIIDKLGRTKPWVLLISILLFLTAAITILAVIPMTMAMFSGVAGAGMGGQGMIIGMGVAYLIFGAIYFMLGLYLFKYSSAIGRAVDSSSGTDVEDALDQQRKFWKVAGIMALVGIVFIVLMIVLMVVGMGGAMFGMMG